MAQITQDGFPENLNWGETNLKVKSIEADGITIPNPDLPDFGVIPRYMQSEEGFPFNPETDRIDGPIILLSAEPNDALTLSDYTVFVKNRNDEIVTSWEIEHSTYTPVNLDSYFVSPRYYVEVGSEDNSSTYGIQYLKLTS